MKWYEQQSNEFESLIGKQLLASEFGVAGYGAYIILKQIIAQNMNDNIDEWGFVNSLETIESLAAKTGLSVDQFRAFIDFCDSRFIFEKRNGRLFCPSLLEEKNEYAKKIALRERKKNQEYPDTPDNTDKSGVSDVTTQHNTTQTHKKKKINKKEKDYSSLESITEVEIEETARKYDVSREFVSGLIPKIEVHEFKPPPKNYLKVLQKWTLNAIEWGNVKKGTYKAKIHVSEDELALRPRETEQVVPPEKLAELRQKIKRMGRSM